MLIGLNSKTAMWFNFHFNFHSVMMSMKGEMSSNTSKYNCELGHFYFLEYSKLTDKHGVKLDMIHVIISNSLED